MMGGLIFHTSSSHISIKSTIFFHKQCFLRHIIELTSIYRVAKNNICITPLHLIVAQRSVSPV